MMTQGEALDILKTGANVFLTGEPGSGKTHTVNAYVEWLHARGIEPAITASTGIAATHIGGRTIHSWSGIGIRRSLSEYDLDAIGQNKNIVRRVSSANVLIIDEVSMLSARTLSMVEAVCRSVRRSERPFGGLQAVLVGDFFQLPPVSRREHSDPEHEERPTSFMFGEEGEESGGREQFAFASSAWGRSELLTCYLSEQHRQEDAEYLTLLSAVRSGTAGEKEKELLLSRFAKDAVRGVTELYSHNADVDTLNSRALSALKGDAKTFLMTSRGPEKLVAPLKRGCLSPEELLLKKGARVMFTKNDARGRFVNGTLGEVSGFEEYGGYPIVRTKGGRVVTAEPDEWRVEEGGRVLAAITQVPLRLAWAMTVHKSQGMSLDAAHMDLTSTFEYGQGYVALSRVRTLSGLSLAGLNARALEVHPEVREKDAEFRSASGAALGAFRQMGKEELQSMHANFIKASGGKEPEPEPKEKIFQAGNPPTDSTRVHRKTRSASVRPRHTFEILASGKSLEEAAEERGRTIETILTHLERLSALGGLDVSKLTHLSSGNENDIRRAIAALGNKKIAHLKPVFDELNGEVPYTTIRLARLLGEFSLPPSRRKT